MKSKHIKQTITLLFTVILSFSFAFAFSAFADNADPVVTVFVDGEQIAFDVDPIIENGRTLVPMRFIFEALDAKVEWVNETNTAIATKNDTKIEITIGENKLIKNGEEIELDVPAKLINDRTLVPVRAVSEGLNAKVDWDGELFRVIITSTDIKTYGPDELSPADLEELKEAFSEYRYYFEQTIVPQAYILQPEGAVKGIENKETAMIDELRFYWDYYLYQIISSIQLESESTYSFPSDDMDEEVIAELLVTSYQSILEKNGMNSTSTFEASFETTPDKNNLLLLTFKNPKSDDPMMITCKYIAVVPIGDKIRVFTLEYSTFAS